MNEYLSITDIGRIYGVSAHVAGRWLKNFGLRTESGQPSAQAFNENTSRSGQAVIPEPSFTSGTPSERPTFSTACAIHGPFMVRSSGNIGQELLDADGRIIAWTTMPWLGELICALLTDFTKIDTKGKRR